AGLDHHTPLPTQRQCARHPSRALCCHSSPETRPVSRAITVASDVCPAASQAARGFPGPRVGTRNGSPRRERRGRLAARTERFRRNERSFAVRREGRGCCTRSAVRVGEGFSEVDFLYMIFDVSDAEAKRVAGGITDEMTVYEKP